MTLSQALATWSTTSWSRSALAPRQWVSSGAAMPSVPKRPGAQEGQRHVGHRGQLRHGLARPRGEDNAELDKCDRVTIDSIRNHTARHFPVQNVAKATYREILERRARANGVDFVEGVATALTPIAFFETVMVKSYETLVDSDTKVDVNTGIVAAGRLQSLIDSRDYEPRSVGDEGPDGPDQ